MSAYPFLTKGAATSAQRMHDAAKGTLIVLGLLLGAGCASVAGTTRTGVVHDVTFDERTEPRILRVRPGDEIRWINQRTMPVTVEFIEPALDNVSCEEGFAKRGLTNLLGKVQESTTIEPLESASLCFASPGRVEYNVRMQSAVAGGEEIERNAIIVF